MKTRILLMLALVVLCFNLSAQPLHWTESLFDPLKTSTILKETVNKTDGNNSMKYTFTDPGTVFLISDTFAVTSGAAYTLKTDYLDNDPQSRLSTRIYFFNQKTNIGTSSTQYMASGRITSANTVKQTTWQTVTTTGTTPAGAVIAMVVVNMNPLASPGVWGGSATFLADNFIYTEGTSTINKIANPSFDDWYVTPGSTVSNWRESLYNVAKTSIIVNEKTKKTEGYNSLKYTFTDDGTPFFISDTFKVTGSSTYNYSIDYLDNDPSGVITARIYYFATKNTSYLERSAVSSSTVDSPNWQKITITGTTPATATLAYAIIRMATATAPAWTGSATFYADNAKYTEGISTTNLISNSGFENWEAPTNAPEFLTMKFSGLNPEVIGVINKTAHTVALEVPFTTDVTTLVSTFTLPDGVTAKVGSTDQVSGKTTNNFTNPVTYALAKGTTTQTWVVTVTKTAPTTVKDILTFKFNGLTPSVTGIVVPGSHTIGLEVPTGTNVTALVATFSLSANATAKVGSTAQVSGTTPNNFSSPVTYTITAQDGSTQTWVVTVTFAVAGQTTLFSENFENLTKIPSTWTLINHDGYTQDPAELRWQDSAWVVSTTSRPELVGTRVAVASSFCANMPLTGRADDWMILPSIALGANSTLSWQAMSLTTSGNYPDDYVVYIAPAVAGTTPTFAYFEAEGNKIFEAAPESWSAAVSRAGAGLASHSINLKSKITPSAPSGWFNRNVWIAFVLSTDRYTNPTTGVPNTTAGGSELAIDNIKVVNNPVTGIDENINNSLAVSIFPNPTTGKFSISVRSDNNAIANVKVTDLIGSTVISNMVPVSVGKNQIDFNLSNLSKGIYLVKTTVKGKTNVSKLIVK
jgi:hypothetical protein